jgi:hypothetical protein
MTKRVIIGLLLAAVGCLLIACGSNSSSTATTTCWNTGTGLVIKTVSTVPGCTATYAYGNPAVSGPVTGLGSPTCTYSFPSGITWWVWDTDNGTSGNAEALCDTLSGE